MIFGYLFRFYNSDSETKHKIEQLFSHTSPNNLNYIEWVVFWRAIHDRLAHLAHTLHRLYLK